MSSFFRKLLDFPRHFCRTVLARRKLFCCSLFFCLICRSGDQEITGRWNQDKCLFVSYLETYSSRLEYWLRDWRIAVNVLKGTTVIFAKTARCVEKPKPRPEPIQRFETARYLGLTLDTQMT